MVNRNDIPGSSSGEKTGAHDGKKILSPRLQFEWVNAVTDDQWSTYKDAICALRAAGLKFLLGGGFALATYVGRWLKWWRHQ